MRVTNGADTIDVPESDVVAFVKRGFWPTRDDSAVAAKAPVLATPASAARKEAAPTKTQAVNFFLGRGNKMRTEAGQRAREDVEGALAALYPSVQPDKSVPRNVAGAAIDLLSLPGRVIASAPAIVRKGESFGQAVARPGGRADDGGVAQFAEDVIRDPANIPMALVGGPAAKVGMKVTEKTAQALGPKIAKALGALTRAEVGAGAPMAATGAARAYSEGRDVTPAVVAPIILAPAADATFVGLKKGAKAIGKQAGKIPNPWHTTVEEAVDQAAKAGEALDYDKTAGWRSEPKLGGVAARVSKSINDALKSETVRSPAITLAKSMLRGQVKPAPMAKKQMEAKGWDEALSGEAGTKLFDQLTSFKDIGILNDPVANMAERGLARAEQLNRAAWTPIQEAADAAKQNYNDAIVAAAKAAGNDPEWSELVSSVYNPHDFPSYMDLVGVKPEDVYRRAQELARGGVDDYGSVASNWTGEEWLPKYTPKQLESGRAEAYGLTKEDVMGPLSAQYEAYKSAYKPVEGTEAMDPTVAHRKKVLQQRRAYQMGDPRESDIANKMQAAASILSQAHNEVVDAALARMGRADFAKPLPPPIIKTEASRAGLEDMAEGLGPHRLSVDEGTADPSYELQKRILAGEAETDPEALAAAISEHIANKDAIGGIRDWLEDKYGAAFPTAEMIDDLSRRINELLERRGQAPSQGPVSSAGATAEPGLSDVARAKVDADMTNILAGFRKEQVDPWIEAFKKYKSTSVDDLADKLTRLRAMDKVTQPWFQIEPALLRAAARSANKTHGPNWSNLMLPLAGGAVGAGVMGGWGPDSLSVRDRMLLGAGTGAGAGLALTRANTPAGAKAVRELGYYAWPSIGLPTKLTLKGGMESAKIDALAKSGVLDEILNAVIGSQDTSSTTSK